MRSIMGKPYNRRPPAPSSPTIQFSNSTPGSTPHKMIIARPSRGVAKRLGLNPNHQARVWCTCMEDALHPGLSGVFSERPMHEVLADPRRLGSYDALGVIDLRVPYSAMALWRAHIREATA